MLPAGLDLCVHVTVEVNGLECKHQGLPVGNDISLPPLVSEVRATAMGHPLIVHSDITTPAEAIAWWEAEAVAWQCHVERRKRRLHRLPRALASVGPCLIGTWAGSSSGPSFMQRAWDPSLPAVTAGAGRIKCQAAMMATSR